MSGIVREVTIGPCRLIQGDCLEVLPEVGRVDAVVTDPPYGAERKASGIRKKTWRRATEYVGAWEDNPEYIQSVVVKAIELCRQLATCTAVTPGFKCLNLYPRAEHMGGFYYQGQSTVTAWGAAWWQPILFYGRDHKTGMLQRDMFIGRSNQEQENNGHPCPKELTTWTVLVERMSFEGHAILDPFMGSGTTGVACIKTGRNFIGIEREPKYFDIAVSRIRRAWQDKCSEIKFDEPTYSQRELAIAD